MEPILYVADDVEDVRRKAAGAPVKTSLSLVDLLCRHERRWTLISMLMVLIILSSHKLLAFNVFFFFIH